MRRCLNRRAHAYFFLWAKKAAWLSRTKRIVSKYFGSMRLHRMLKAFNTLRRELYFLDVLKRCCKTILRMDLNRAFQTWRNGKDVAERQQALMRRVAMMLMGQEMVLSFTKWRQAGPLLCPHSPTLGAPSGLLSCSVLLAVSLRTVVMLPVVHHCTPISSFDIGCVGRDPQTSTRRGCAAEDSEPDPHQEPLHLPRCV
jgi:hypothetical protein